MSDKSIDKVLQQLFPQSGKVEWKKIALAETNGKDPNDFLSWTGKDNILFLPYYDAEDVTNLHYLSRFQLPPQNSFSGARFWANLPAVIVKDEKNSNHNALNHLSFGADGILFDLTPTAKVNMTQLLDKIEWQYCFVSFQMNNSSHQELLAKVIKNKFEAGSVTGALFWESIPKKNNLNFYFDHCRKIKSLGLTIPVDTPTKEISEAITRGVDAFRTFSHTAEPLTVFNSISFSLSSGQSFFENFAKLKALRILWYQVAHAYSLTDYKFGDLHIHSRCGVFPREDVSGPENLVASTFSAMSAILGGCDSLTIVSTPGDSTISRLSRNVSNILKEESFFDRVADPLSGAYAFDAMVDALARKAWELFQIKSRSL